jgi:hypothetical protein
MSPLELDALIDRVVAEESATLHESFLDGAEFAVTRMDSPRHRRLHRLECAVMDQYLDRAALWTDARRARGLRATHAGRILSTAAGESLGSIARVSARTGPDLFGRPVDAIEVTTSSRVFAYTPMEDVYLWNLPPDAEVIERKFRLFQLLGADLAPAG